MQRLQSSPHVQTTFNIAKAGWGLVRRQQWPGIEEGGIHPLEYVNSVCGMGARLVIPLNF